MVRASLSPAARHPRPHPLLPSSPTHHPQPESPFWYAHFESEAAARAVGARTMLAKVRPAGGAVAHRRGKGAAGPLSGVGRRRRPGTCTHVQLLQPVRAARP